MIVSTDLFDLLDAQRSFSKQLPQSNGQCLQLRADEFQVKTPYYRAGQKRKRDDSSDDRDQRNKADVETEQRHKELRPFLVQCLEQIPKPLQQSHRESKGIEEGTDDDLKRQDDESIDFVGLSEMARIQSHFAMPSSSEQTMEQDVNAMEVLDVFNSWIKNRSDTCKFLELRHEKQPRYVIPPRSAFYMGDMASSMTDLVAESERVAGFDFIVMDPPWPNKSVHRSGRYETQDIYQLFQIPMPKIMSSGSCLVAVWVTNKPKFRRFVTDKLFKKWKIKEIGTWLWIKVTTQGEPVIPLDSPHRKPYEQLVVGYYSNDVTLHPNIPKERAIVSVPCRRHSRKPPLQGKPYSSYRLEHNFN